MAGLHDLTREYEARRFPASRQLDLHGDAPGPARERALRWIQSFAHEQPGEEVLLIVERSRRPTASPVRQAVERLLRELDGRLIEWWQAFGPGSLAVRIARDPRLVPFPAERPAAPKGEGRTPETAGAVLLSPHDDIPEELLGVAHRAAELRRMREGLSLGLADVILRRVWIEAQATAMSERITFQAALLRIVDDEQARMLEEE